MVRVTWGSVLVVLAVLAAGCGGGAESTPPPQDESPSTTTDWFGTGDVELSGPAKRCGPPQDDDARRVEIAGPGGSTLSAVEVGRGPVTTLMLHQTDGGASCGWWPYATWLTQDQDVRALLVDLCGYGESDCRGDFADDSVAQTRLALGWLRTQGARRVTLVGASMGGAVAAGAAADVHGVDAAVVLSGALPFDGAGTPAQVRAIDVPTLFACDPWESGLFDLAKAATRQVAGPTAFDTGDGHGWDMVGARDGATYVPSPLGERVATVVATAGADLG